MTHLVGSLFKHSRHYLRRSYRFIHKEVNGYHNNENNNTTDHLSSQEKDEDAPITLEENPFTKDRKKCILCEHKIEPDYKNVRLLSQFQSSFTGRIYGRHITGLCKAKQEKVEIEILKAQNCGLMPVYHKVPEYLHDPKLFDPDHPFRPHKY